VPHSVPVPQSTASSESSLYRPPPTLFLYYSQMIQVQVCSLQSTTTEQEHPLE